MRSLVLFVVLEIGVLILSSFMTPSVSGGRFLLYYFVLWGGLVFVAESNSWKGVIPSVIYFSAGISRFIAGKEHGMTQFTCLWAMMCCGIVVYLIECDCSFIEWGRGGGGCSSGGGGGGCSGCGGGGGGGGGCGGCGGG